ncbi:MAG: helix-turn-helix transcriptional regulator [Alphaproteobacteria bacterium]|nr:helix-turn-helix transcriptional regulator [Alphaproteobacteria bacterium]
MNWACDLSAGQIRAGRALLNWSQEDLAHACRLSVSTVRKLELGYMSPRHATTRVIRQCMEKAGLEFIEPNGVRRRPDSVTVYEGSRGMASLIEDIEKAVRKDKSEILIVTDLETANFPDTDFCVRLADAISGGGVKIKCLIPDTFQIPFAMPNFEYRAVSKNYVNSIPFFVYGDRQALIVAEAASTVKIVSIESPFAAWAGHRQFYSMWEMAFPMYSRDFENSDADRLAAHA